LHAHCALILGIVIYATLVNGANSARRTLRLARATGFATTSDSAFSRGALSTVVAAVLPGLGIGRCNVHIDQHHFVSRARPAIELDVGLPHAEHIGGEKSKQLGIGLTVVCPSANPNLERLTHS
jgi:hypothetical protein